MSPNEQQLDQSNETPGSIRVRVLFFGAAREIVGHDEILLDLREPALAASAFEQVLETYPVLRRFGRSLLFAVNQEYAQEDALREVRAGDELAIFPPVSGGAESQTHDEEVGEENFNGPDFFELTTEPIAVGAVARRVVLPECGATVTLDGYVREWTRGRRTRYLVYEAYGPMALSEMRRLCHQVRERFDISHVGIVHRTGRLEIGETSVVVSISAPHRRAAFEACEWTIKELKRTVPIWKKEFYEDGEVWVEGEGTPAELQN